MFSPDRARIATNVLLIAALVLCAALFYPIWQPTFLACVVAAVLDGPKERLTARLGGRRNLAVSLILVGVTCLLVLPVAVLTTIAVSQTVNAVGFIREALSTGGVNELLGKLPNRIESGIKKLIELAPGGIKGLLDKVGGGAQVADWVSALFSTVSEAIFQIGMVLIALYFLLLDGRDLVAWIVERSPLGVIRSKQLLNTYRRASRAVLASTIITAAAQSVVAGVGYLIARVPQPLFFTLLTFLTAFVPSVGTAIVALPLCGLLWATGHTVAAIFLGIYSVLVVATVDNLIKPYLIGDGIQLNGGLIFFSLVGGVIAFGPIGLVLGPLSLTFFFSIIALEEERTPTDVPGTLIVVSPTGAPKAPASSSPLPTPGIPPESNPSLFVQPLPNPLVDANDAKAAPEPSDRDRKKEDS